MRQIVDESLPKIEQLFEHKKLITGVPTPFEDLNAMTRGLQPSDLVIVAARPSMGKTSLVLNMAEYAALEHGQTVGLFQPGNVEGAAVHPPADVRGADRRASAPDRHDRSARLRPAVTGHQPD